MNDSESETKKEWMEELCRNKYVKNYMVYMVKALYLLSSIDVINSV